MSETSEEKNLSQVSENEEKAITPNVPNPYDPYLAQAYYERLAKYIISFEKKLADDEEVGAKLVAFGENITIHIHNLGFWNPSLICFYGLDSRGQEVQLIQHVNQISILLMKVKRAKPERPRVGFRLEAEQEQEEQNQTQLKEPEGE